MVSTWVEIDLEAIANNIRLIRAITKVKVMAVVKANAYGHGLHPVAKKALEAGASWLGVARVEEAIGLREAGLNCPILLLGYTPPEQYESAVTQNISLTIWNQNQADSIATIARRLGTPAHVHLKVDTGMSRLGIQPQDCLDLATYLAKLKNVNFEGVFTHFARADEDTPEPTDIQEKVFEEVLERLTQAGVRPPLVHAANSAAGLFRPNARYDLVRAGIAIYGLHPSKTTLLPDEFRPALTWKSVLCQVKMLPAGRGVSYGHVYTTQGTEQIGTIPVGYADGFRRIPGNQVLIKGVKVPVIGRVCMDQSMVLLNQALNFEEADEVVIIGSQGDARISAEELADAWGTINYEVVCGIGARVPRSYL